MRFPLLGPYQKIIQHCFKSMSKLSNINSGVHSFVCGVQLGAGLGWGRLLVMNDEDIWILNKINVLCKLYKECLLTYLATSAKPSLFCRMEINICIYKILQREESFLIYDLLDHLKNMPLDAIRFNHFVSQNVINIYLVPPAVSSKLRVSLKLYW